MDELKAYIANMGNAIFVYDPKGRWNRAKGDKPTTTNNTFFAQTQLTTAEPPVYRVQIIHRPSKVPAVLPIVIPVKAGEEPSNEDIIAALRARVGLTD
ncbi:hypothetical protein NX059_002236 [Plenodomus lindquistii]|nr:hypothetical protein NX059_002236 [Plenodomus lindquistii]